MALALAMVDETSSSPVPFFILVQLMLVHQCLSIPLFQSPDSRTRGDDTGRYSRLELAAAWRVENHDLYCGYKVAQRKVLSFAAKEVELKGDTKVRIRNELYGSASKLPGDLETGCNEVRLLHGTKPGAFLCLLPFFECPTFTSLPVSVQATCLRDMTLLIRMCVSVYWIDMERADLVWPIVQQGMNERFAGASAGTAFGDVSVCCTPTCVRSCDCACVHRHLHRSGSSGG
jgi:hypothetical protein